MIIRNKFNGYVNGNNRLYPGGGGGPTQSTSYQTNIPEYARPYVESMLGATQKQIFTGTGSGADFKPTGFNAYTPYGATYQKDATGAPLKDASGNIMYTNTAQQQAQAAVAPQSYGQQAATFNVNNYANPMQTGSASQMTADLAARSAAAGYYSPLRAERFQLGTPQQVRSDSFTAPGVSQAYMSPYMQNVVNAQQREARRAGEIQRNQNQAQAVGQGAFGGSRQGIIEAERQRNLATQLGDIQGQGLQSAYQQGMGQFNAEQNAYLQAQQANQQANMQTGVQNLQALQQAQAAQESSRQFGAQLGLQGYNQAGQLAGQLGQLGQQQYGQEMGLYQAMADLGAKEQAQDQAVINQQIQNYATQQQYPYMQLGIMSNMLRGLPMQAGNTSMYQAQPMGIQQAVGMAGALSNLGKKEGGVIKMAGGGVASGVNRNELPSMAKRLSDPQLQQKLSDQQTDPETMGIMQAESQRRVNTRKAVMAAGGGMIAFAEGSKKAVDEVDNPFKDNPYPIREDIGAEKKPVTPTDKAKKKAESATPKAKDMYSEYDESMKAAQEGAFSDTKKQLVEREKVLPALQAEADKSIATRVADMRQTNKDLGIKDEHTKALRDSFEQQIAASAEESREEAKLRKAQAWAVFGSTPGPLLKVGLQALSGYIDDKIADESKRKKMQSELKKSLYELDRSSYLESVGMAKEAREHHLTAFNTVNNLRDKIADDRRALETKDYEFKKGAAETKLKAKEREQERKLTLEAARIGKGSNLNEEKLETKQTQLTRAALEAFEKSKDGQKLSDYESMKSLSPDGFKAVEKDYERLKKKQDDLKTALKESYSRAKGLDATPAPSAAPSAADISFTAKKYGITEDEVKKRLGVK